MNVFNKIILVDIIVIFVKKKLNYIDIFIICVLIFGFVRGYWKGLVMEVTSILAIFLGIYGSIKLADITYNFLSKNFPGLLENIDENHLKIASFVFTFFIIIILTSLAGKAITKALKMVFLGFANKVFGGFFGVCKFTLLLSICFIFFNNLNSTFEIIKENPSETSFLYSIIVDIGNFILKTFKLSDNSFNFFD